MNSTAQSLAIEAIPLPERACGRTILDLLRYHRGARPLAPALIWLPQGRVADQPVTFTYGELSSRIHQLANLLHSRGVTMDAPVTLLLPNLAHMHLLLWAGAIAGTVSPVNPFLSIGQIAGIMQASGSRSIVIPSASLEPELAAKARAVARLLENLDVVFVAGPPEPDAISLEACGDQPADRLAFDRQIDPDNVAALLHTGGTTGTPKLVRQTHWNQVATATIAAMMMEIGPGDPVLTGLPLFHTNATIVTGLAVLSAGGTVVLAGRHGFRSRDTLADFWRIVDRYRVSTFCAVPTILSSLLDIPVGDADISSLRVAVCGAAPLSPSLFNAFERAVGLRILEGYGLTEGTALSTVNPLRGERRIGSVGLPIPYHRVVPAIIDSAGVHVRDCAIGETGELLLSGETVTPGYKLPAHNARAWPKPGWLNTGDLGRVDAEGYIWLAGRSKDIIIRGGHNIDPAMIEDALAMHPGVELAAGVGRPDTYAGEVPVAFVTLRAGYAATEDELASFARAHVGERAAAPVIVTILDAMPMTAVGKIFKPTLRERASERAVREVVQAAGLGYAVQSITARHEVARGLVVNVSAGLHQKAVADVVDAARLPLAIEVSGDGGKGV